jgi:hypothetical protein
MPAFRELFMPETLKLPLGKVFWGFFHLHSPEEACTAEVLAFQAFFIITL